MKILLITVRSDFGGGPRHVDQLIGGLCEGNDIYVAYPQKGDPYASQWNENPQIKGRIFIPYRKFSFRTLFEMKKFIERNSIDIIHSHGNGAGIYSRLLKMIGVKAKVVHTFHGVTDDYANCIKKNANKLLGRFLRHFTNKFIFVSCGEMGLARKMGFMVDERSVVIYNGIEAPFVATHQEMDAFRVVTLSRFDYQKNMDLAYEVAKKMKGDPVRFVWVGNGDDWNRLKKQAEQDDVNIDFVGFSTKAMDYLANASAYLSTSRFEGLPYALIEAAGSALPIIATNVVGNNEVVLDKKTGFLYNTAEEACAFIRALLHDSDLRKKMSLESRKFFEQEFTLAMMVKKVNVQYASLM